LSSFDLETEFDYLVSLNNGETKPVRVIDLSGESEGNQYFVNIEGNTARVSPLSEITSFVYTVSFGESDTITVQILDQTATSVVLSYAGTKFTLNIWTPEQAKLKNFMLVATTQKRMKVLNSPMPGRIIVVDTKVGDEVVTGQQLCVVEAMKMQNVLYAEKDGKVKHIKVVPGAHVQADQVLIEFE